VVVIPEVRRLLFVLIVIWLRKQPAGELVVWRGPGFGQAVRARFRPRPVQMRDEGDGCETAKGAWVGPFQCCVHWHAVGHTVEAVDIGDRERPAALDLEGGARKSYPSCLAQTVSPDAGRQRRAIRAIEAQRGRGLTDGQRGGCIGSWLPDARERRIERIWERRDKLPVRRGVERRQREISARPMT
jgi:hypothetical protein